MTEVQRVFEREQSDRMAWPPVIAGGRRWRRCLNSGTMRELVLSHLCIRVSHLGGKDQ